MDNGDAGSLLGLERIALFSDAIFAIAATLLALEIRLPEVHNDVFSWAIVSLLPSIAVYALSFVVIAAYWVGHHRMFRFVRAYDYGLIWLNNIFLLCIAFMPAANGVLVRHYREPAAVLFYGGALCVTSLSSILLWFYVGQRSSLQVAGTRPREFRLAMVRNFGAIVVTAGAILWAFLSPISGLVLLAVYLLWDIAEAVRNGIPRPPDIRAGESRQRA